MSTVHELVKTLRALDNGKETKAMRECMQELFRHQQELRDYVSHCPLVPRRNLTGVWVTQCVFGAPAAPMFMPLGVPFTVWETSVGGAHVEMNEYTLVRLSPFEVPMWVHDTTELGYAFEQWCVGAPPEISASLGSSVLVAHTLRRALQCDGVALTPNHFMCIMLRTPKFIKKRSGNAEEMKPSDAEPQYVPCIPKQNLKFGFFQDGTHKFPFTMSRWLKCDCKGGAWEQFPLLLPPNAQEDNRVCVP